MARERAKPNFGDLGDFSPSHPKPKQKQPKKEIEVKARTVATEEGFTSRATKPKVDGRTLRATGRTTQLNMAVKPETRDIFWQSAKDKGFTNGEEFLLHLLSCNEK